MTLYGKIFYSVGNVGYEQAFIQKELDRKGVGYHTQVLNDTETILWFAPSQVPFLPAFLGVHDLSDAQVNATQPGYYGVEFYRVDTRMNLNAPYTTSRYQDGTFPQN